MLHVDEGELHAWLDGALDQLGEDRAAQVREHLRVCASCREALVEEEMLRARAEEVLALAAPASIDAPPFETLMERARALPAPASPQVAPATRLSRVARLGWAASVVVALGAGWMARTIDLPSGSGDEAGVAPLAGRAAAPSESVEAPASVAAAPTAGAGVTRTLPQAPAVPERRAGSEPSGSRAESVAPGASGPSADAARDVVAAAPPEGAPLGTVAGTMAETIAGKASESVVVTAAASAEPAPSAPAPSAPAPTSSEITPRREAAASSNAGMAQPTTQRRTVALVSRRPREGEASAMAVRSSGVGLSRGPDTTSVPGLFQRGRASAGATKVEVSTLADEDEAVDLIVPGLPVLRVEWTQVAPGRPGLRVLQRLSPTDTLEVRFVRSGGAAADAAADPLAAVVGVPLPAGVSQVVRVHRDGWVVARAPVSPVELEALVDRVGQTSAR